MKAIVGAAVPDYRGMFLRGHGSQNHAKNNGSTVGNTNTTHSSGNLGQIQGDAARNITGSSVSNGLAYCGMIMDVPGGSQSMVTGTGAIGLGSGGGIKIAVGTALTFSTKGMTFNSAKMVPTATENRPANMAVKYIICAKE